MEETNKNMVVITKVVSKNFIMDIVAKIENFFGSNLKPYETMIQKGVLQIKQELQDKKIKMKWFRYSIMPLTQGAAVIMFFGEKEQ